MRTLIILLVSASLASASPITVLGGSPPAAVVGAWYDNGTFAATTSDTDVANEASGGFSWGGVITPTSSGSCTKVRVYFGWVNVNGTCKAALYTTGGTLLSNGSVSVTTTAADRFYEITLAAPQAVTASTTYVVMYMVSGLSTAQGRHVIAASGSGKVNTTATYAAFPTSPVTLSNTTAKVLAGMWVE